MIFIRRNLTRKGLRLIMNRKNKNRLSSDNLEQNLMSALKPGAEQTGFAAAPKEEPVKGIPAVRALSNSLSIALFCCGLLLFGAMLWAIELHFKPLSERNLNQSVQQLSTRIDTFLNDRIQILHDYASLPLIGLALQHPENSRTYLEDVMGNLPLLGRNHKTVLLDLNGQPIYSTKGAPVFDYGHASFINSFRKNAADHHSSVSGNGTNTFWRLAVPVHLNEKLLGTLLTEMPLSELDESLHLSSMLENEQVQLIKHGKLIASYGPEISASPHIAYLDRHDLQLFYRVRFRPLIGFQKELIITTGIILLLSALFTLRLTTRLSLRSFVNPLESLREMATAMANGKTAEQPPAIHSNILEIQLLFRDFNLMADTIRKREFQLRSAHESMELRVIERTRDLKESHRRIASILGNIQSGIMVVDPDSNKIIEANAACAAILGVPEDDLPGKSGKIFTENTAHYTTQNLTPGYLEQNKECTITNAQGQTITILKNTVPIDYAGKVHLLISFIDISERKQALNELEKARKKEVNLAAHIQETLLIGTPPAMIGNLKISALSVPSQTVSGDFYDYHCWSGSKNCLDLIIGDVMGKGINAALLAAGIKTAWHQALISALESESHAGLPPTGEIVYQLHLRIVPELIAFESFITLCYARLNIEQQLLEFVHCGHTEIIRWNDYDKRCTLHVGTSPPMGMLEDEEYTTLSLPFKANDCFLFFSDGLTETRNPEGEMFGTERLCRIIGKNHKKSAAEILDIIENSIRQFCAGGDFADDLSCILIKVDPLSQPPRQLPGISLSQKTEHSRTTPES
ncbi:PAS domain S-box protein [Verrucomicrobia bacterium S94]|nr:PAS domain S-box protein [Verrucomicrobia bacterium S94]